MGPVSDRRGRPLSADDCRCPVCLDIFVEPVTLPCSHTFCKNCFLESVDKATLCCPMCRKRVSTWARHSSRNNSLVNQKLWTQIQTCFPLQCQRRLSGQEDEDDAAAVSTFLPRVSEPGELRQEYEDQVFKLTEEKRVMDEEEKKASDEYIQKLLAEEQELLQQDMRRREEDEQLARQLSTQLNSAPSSQEVPCPANSASAKKKEVESGQIERFLCPLPFKSSSPDSNKENVLSEVKLQVTLPFLSPPHGSQLTSLHPEDQTLRNQFITDGHPSSSKRKASTEEEEEIVVTKRGCSSSSLELGGSVLQCQMEMLSRQQQEEEDRHFALLLQKELDKEERQRCPDRSKGSTDAYPLRQTHRSKVEGKTPSRASRRTSTSSPSSALSSSSSSKQTTLTELFSNLRS